MDPISEYSHAEFTHYYRHFRGADFQTTCKERFDDWVRSHVNSGQVSGQNSTIYLVFTIKPTRPTQPDGLTTSRLNEANSHETIAGLFKNWFPEPVLPTLVLLGIRFRISLTRTIDEN